MEATAYEFTATLLVDVLKNRLAEGNMKTLIKSSICAAAGTALLGRSGDMFPTP
jgi:hypothetical protein